VLNPTIGATRTEEDFKNHIVQTLDTDQHLIHLTLDKFGQSSSLEQDFINAFWSLKNKC